MKWIAPFLAYLSIALGIFVFQSAWGALLAFHLAILISLFAVKPGIPLRTLRSGHNMIWLWSTVVLCASSGLAVYFLWDKFGIVGDISMRVAAMGLNSSSWLPFIAYFSLVNPWLEEYFWRGYLGNPGRHLHTSDFLYAGFHGLILINKVHPLAILFSLAVLVFAGWFWRQIARVDGGLRAPVLGHMAADLTILLAVYVRLQAA
jgi:hypothetical protein